MQPSELRCTLLSYDAFFWAMLHPTELRLTQKWATWHPRNILSPALPDSLILTTKFIRVIPRYFLFRGRVRNEITRVCSYFCSRNGIPRSFLFRGRVRNRNSESFLFRGAAGIPSEIIIISVYSVFRWINFLSEIPNPIYEQPVRGSVCFV